MTDQLTLIVVSKLDAPNSPAVLGVFADVAAWCKHRKVDMIVFPSEALHVDKNNKLVVAIGGDGTVITAAKIGLQFKCPVIGFNLGKVGFLADFDPKQVNRALEAAYLNQLKCDSRALLSITIDGVEHLALNDVVVSCEQSDTSLRYDLGVGMEHAGSHTANGVILSTATGSTAYAMAVGGAIMHPLLADVMQVTPIAAQTLTSRPLIVPSDPGVTIKFQVHNLRPVNVRCDGVVVARFANPDPGIIHTSLKVKGHNRYAQMLHHFSWNHFDVLTEKLYWNR